jgi:hypothetical protein
VTSLFQKRFLLMLGGTLAVILLGFVTLSFQSRPTQTKPTTLPPTVTPEPTPVLDTALERAVLEALFPYLKESTLQAEGGNSWLMETAVSSGVFRATHFNLDSGLDVTLDILQAYVLMRPGKVLEVPMVIGFQSQEQPYAYFSDLYFYQNLYQIPSPAYPSREEALADAKLRLPRGRIFLLTAEGGVSAEGLDWEACLPYMRDFRRYPAEICQIGAAMEQTYPGQLASFVQKFASSFPTSWLLAGWFFQELNPQDNPDIQTDIDLPTIP